MFVATGGFLKKNLARVFWRDFDGNEKFESKTYGYG